ncbi:uncharacterized protein PAC_12840 [Phialocephala subalpina]|uniref:C2H2-type domain-containing protein n=1 Tax=Phialocephala subalpina TaxID=576137 RepID=A0A1L7XD50_9HELO|nr:uncharacterized protein PAC_12840 [Phialocephala subalpina]
MEMDYQNSLDHAFDWVHNDRMLNDGFPCLEFDLFFDANAYEGSQQGDPLQDFSFNNQNADVYEDRRVLNDDFGNTNEECVQAVLDPVNGKCRCRICINKAAIRELDGLFSGDVPESVHNFTFQMPDDDNQLSDPNVFSTTPVPFHLSAVLPPRISEPQQRDVVGERKKKKKRKRSAEALESNAKAVALMLLRSTGDLPDKLRAELEQFTGNAQRTRPLQIEPVAPSSEVETGTRSPSYATPRSAPTSLRREVPVRAATSSSFKGRAVASEVSANTATITRSQPAAPRTNIIYQCTYRGREGGIVKQCQKSYISRYEWERHERSVHKERLLCKECALHDHPEFDGGHACSYCMNLNLPPFYSFEAVKRHMQQCTSPIEKRKPYHRKDKLRDHLREHHLITDPPETSFEWVYDIDSEWWGECGFCGELFGDWNDRRCHIEAHFKDGAQVATWTVPFSKERTLSSGELDDSVNEESEDENDQDSEDSNEEDDEDDDEDDNDDDGNNDQASKGHSRNDTWGSPTQSHNFSTHTASDNGYHEANIQNPGYQYQHGVPVVEFDDGLHSLNRYLTDDEQHERLILGIGRRPMNITIGARQSSAPAICSPQESNIQTQGPNLPVAPLDEEISEVKSASDVGELQPQGLALAPSTPKGTSTVPPLNSLGATHSLMTGRVHDCVWSQDQPHVPVLEIATRSLFVHQFSNAAPAVSNKKDIRRRLAPSRTLSDISSTSTSIPTTRTQSSLSRRSSRASTVASHNDMPWHVQVSIDTHLIGLMTQGMDDQLWHLPCEFAFTGCNVRFLPSRYADWFAHSLSHFLGNLPRKAVCWFCDEKDGVFEAHGSLISSWADRMHHISVHLEAGLSIEYMRPDYWLMKHLWSNGLLDVDTYENATRYNERPACSGLLSFEDETDDMIQKKEKSLQRYDDLVKESRLLRVHDRKGKAVDTLRSSHVLQAIDHTQVEDHEASNELRTDQSPQTKKWTSIGKNGQDSRVPAEGCEEQDQNDKPAASVGSPLDPTCDISNDEDKIDYGEALPKSNEMVGTASRGSLPALSEELLASSSSLSTSSSDKNTSSLSGFSDITSLSPSESSETLQKNNPARIREASRRSHGSRYSSPAVVHHRDNQTSYSYAGRAPSIVSSTPDSIERLSPKNSSMHYGYKSERVEKRRVPDNPRHYMTTTTSSNGTKVHAHEARRYDRDEPRASDAQYEDYKRTEDREYRKYYSSRR